MITDSSVDVCMGTEAEQKAFLTVVGKRLFAGSTRYTCVLPVTLLEWNKFSQWFLALGRGVVWVSVVRSVDQTLCDVYQAWLHIFWGRKRRHFFGTCFPSLQASIEGVDWKEAGSQCGCRSLKQFVQMMSLKLGQMGRPLKLDVRCCVFSPLHTSDKWLEKLLIIIW